MVGRPVARFRCRGRCKNNGVQLDPQLIVLMALTSGVGWLMIESGVLKNLLERRRRSRICPSCGRNATMCVCG
jgi:hypothetical protein